MEKQTVEQIAKEAIKKEQGEWLKIAAQKSSEAVKKVTYGEAGNWHTTFQLGYTVGYLEGRKDGKEWQSAQPAGDGWVSDAIEFVKWKDENEYQINNIEQINHTVEELYQIFLNQKPPKS